MSSQVTNRVYMPDGRKIYVSDDAFGQLRFEELYTIYGNCKVEACWKVWGTTLDDCVAWWAGDLREIVFS